MFLSRLLLLTATLAAQPAHSTGSSGDGRFNKAYCLKGAAWGNASFWQHLASTNTTRTAQLTTNTTGGTFYLFVPPNSTSFALSPFPKNVTVDLGCQPRSLPSYGGVAYGSYGINPVSWARGPIGDAQKEPRCWWVRCTLDEARADTCGSEGEQPCARLNATFLRYTNAKPLVDEACYAIAEDSQVDAVHRVDWVVRFVDGLLPPPPH